MAAGAIAIGIIRQTSYSLVQLTKLYPTFQIAKINALRTSLSQHSLSLTFFRKMASEAQVPLPLPVEEDETYQKPEEVLDPPAVIPVPEVDTTDSLPPSVTLTVPEPDADTKLERIKKRKVALLLSYCGQGYYGMQKNPDTSTIEHELFTAMMKNDYMTQEHFDKPQFMNFQRCARTDKNVSAARQVCSFKAPETFQISKVNELLPPAIRVMGIKRVTKGFDAKNSCDARTYSYMLPTFAFAPIETIITESYRITPEVLEEVRSVFSNYTGTKNYHNFTSRKRPGDPSAQRHMMSFTVSDPWEVDGIEYLLLKVKGQSFMLHQIRKMIGLATAVCRGFTDKSVFEKAFSRERIDIPRAPGVGLMLDEVHFTRYNERYGKDGMHDAITWDGENDKVEAFCKDFIYPIVEKAEKEERSMLNWLETLSYHSYDVREHDQQNMNSKIGNARIRVKKENGGLGDDDEDDLDSEDDEDEGSRKKGGKRFKPGSKW